MTFIDLENAYDRVDRDAMWQVLRIYGVGGRLLKVILSFYSNKNVKRLMYEKNAVLTVLYGQRCGVLMSEKKGN